MELLKFLLLGLALAVAFNILFRSFGLPTIIGYICTGVTLRYFYELTQSKELANVAEFGLVFLMFSIGLEFSFTLLMQMKRAVFLNGALQIILTTAVIALLAKALLSIDANMAIILGLCLAMSSTAIVLKILNDSGDIKKRYGRKALGILIFQDLAVIPLFLMIDFYDSSGGDITHLLITTAISGLVLLVLLYLISEYVFGAILHFVIKSNSDEIFIAAILFTVIGASSLAHYFGFSYSLGAFVAGVLLAKTRYKPKIETELIPFRDLLLGLFFISIGLQIDLLMVARYWFELCILVFVLMALKFGVIFSILFMYSGRRVALKTALALAQVGEFAIAVFSLIQSRHFLSAELCQVLISAAILTMVLTPFVIKNVQKLADVAIGDGDYEKDFKEKLREHFVIIGYGPTGQELVMRLRHKGLPYIVLESDLNLVDLGKVRGENVHFSNAANPRSIEMANIKEASAVIITLSNEDKLRLIMQNLENFKDIQIIVRSYKKLRELGISTPKIHIIRPEESLAKDLFQEALNCKLGSVRS